VEPGETVAGRYTIERELGRGGMGSVFEAKDEKLGSRVALKIVAASGLSYDEMKERLRREARIGDRLGRSEGFVRALDWGEIDGSRLYLAMDLVPGASPLDLATGTLTERLARLAQAATLVALAHEKGVIHRDLKPQNFLVASDGRTFLADFGLAKLKGDEASPGEETPSVTRTGLGMGTPSYMPPEQFEDARSADERADVYALGVLLFFALAGKLPYEGAPSAIHKRQIRVQEGLEPPPRPAAVAADVPATLDALCLEALALEPAKRLASAGAFVRALERALEAAASAETIPVLPAVASPARSTTRRPKVGLVLAIVAALIALVVVGASYAGWRARRQAMPYQAPTVRSRDPGGVIIVGSTGEWSDYGGETITVRAAGSIVVTGHTNETGYYVVQVPLRDVKTTTLVLEFGAPPRRSELVSLEASPRASGTQVIFRGHVVPGEPAPGDGIPDFGDDRSEFVVELVGLTAPHNGKRRAVTLTDDRCEPRVQTAVKGDHLDVENRSHAECTAGPFTIKAGEKTTLRLIDHVTLKIGGVAWGFVRASDDVAVLTDAGGAFEIRDVPSGTHVVRVWHPLLVEPRTLDVKILTWDPIELRLDGAKWLPR